MNLPILNLWRYREAIYNLALLNLRVRYSNSVLGFLWSLGNPLFFMLIYTFVFTVLLSSGIENYPIFVLSAILPWNFFNTALMGSITSVTNARDLLTKLAFPREILPLSTVVAEFVNFMMAVVAITGILTLLGVGPGWSVVALPLVMLILALFAMGIGMLLATLNVRLRDTQEFMSVFMLGWFFLTPIVYSLDGIPADRKIIGLNARSMIEISNPRVSVVTTFREVLYLRQWPQWGSIAATGLLSLLIFLVGLFVFRRRSPFFAEEI
jgi:lipopolysaccharide transport system permease protein